MILHWPRECCTLQAKMEVSVKWRTEQRASHDIVCSLACLISCITQFRAYGDASAVVSYAVHSIHCDILLAIKVRRNFRRGESVRELGARCQRTALRRFLLETIGAMNGALAMFAPDGARLWFPSTLWTIPSSRRLLTNLWLVNVLTDDVYFSMLTNPWFFIEATDAAPSST